MDEILEFINKKDYSAAKPLILDRLKEEPQNIELQKLCGLCNINSGLYEEALKNFDFAAAMDSSDAVSMYYAAVCSAETNRFEKAEKLLNELLKLRPEYIDAYKVLFSVYLKTEQYNKIFETGNRLLNENVCDAQIYDILASAAAAVSSFEDAVLYLKKALDLEPENYKFKTKLGIACFAAGRIDAAMGYYNEVLKKAPDDVQALYNLGLAYYALEDFENAYTYLKSAYEKGMKDCLDALALSAYKAGHYNEGIEYYTELSGLYPDNDNYQYSLACCYDGVNDLESASKIIERLLTFNLNAVKLKLHLASIYSRQGRNEAAKVLYADALSQGFTDKNIMYEYAVICAKTKDTDKAEELFKNILKMDADYAPAYKDLGVLYASRRLFDRAEEYFKKAAKAAPDNIYILFETANFYNLLSDYKKAQRVYNKILDNENAPSFMQLAAAKNYLILNQPKKAKEILVKICAKEPSNPEVLFNLAQVFMIEKNYEGAKELLETAYTVSPSVETAALLAKAYMENGLYDKSYNLYKYAALSAPESITLKLAMAECKTRQKDYSAALEHLKPVLDLFPEHEEANEILERIKKGE